MACISNSMVSYKFWDSHHSDVNPRDAMETVLPLFLCHSLSEKESDNGLIYICLNASVAQPSFPFIVKPIFLLV